MTNKKNLMKLLAAFLAAVTAFSCVAIGTIYAAEIAENDPTETTAAVDTTVAETTLPEETAAETTVPAETAAPVDTAVPEDTKAPENNTVNTDTYIGAENAIAIAVADSGVTGIDVTKIKAKLDKENGIMVYDVEFDCANMEYDYEIDAITGDILEKKIDADDDKHDGKHHDKHHGKKEEIVAEETKFIGEAAAKAAAVAHAGVDEASAIFNKIKLDKDDGKVVYEIKFKVDTTKYEYDVDAYTGDILDSEKCTTKADKKEDKIDVSKLDTVKLVGEDAAKAAAVAHAGIDATKAKFGEIELDRDSCGVVYEVEFVINGVEYEYDIDAYSGEVLKSETERD